MFILSLVFIVYYRSNFYSFIKNTIYILDYKKLILFLIVMLLLTLNIYISTEGLGSKILSFSIILLTSFCIYYPFSLNFNEHLSSCKANILKNLSSLLIIFFSIVFLQPVLFLKNLSFILLGWYMIAGSLCFFIFYNTTSSLISYNDYLNANSKEFYKLFNGVLFFLYSFIIFERTIGFTEKSPLNISIFSIYIFISLLISKFVFKNLVNKIKIINYIVIINFTILAIFNYWSKINVH